MQAVSELLRRIEPSKTPTPEHHFLTPGASRAQSQVEPDVDPYQVCMLLNTMSMFRGLSMRILSQFVHRTAKMPESEQRAAKIRGFELRMVAGDALSKYSSAKTRMAADGTVFPHLTPKQQSTGRLRAYDQRLEQLEDRAMPSTANRAMPSSSSGQNP